MTKSFKKFAEEKDGLADIKPTTDVSGPEGELINDLTDILKKNADCFRRLFSRLIHKEQMSTDEENDLKKLIGIIGHLKERPEEKNSRLRDPLDNVVVRPHGGADGSSGDVGSGGGE